MPESDHTFLSRAALREEDDTGQVAAARRDPEAFGALYDRYVQPVYRYLLSRLRNQEEAQDLTSQTFLAAYQAFPRYRHNGHFPAWLFAIARSRWVDHLRKIRREQRTVDPGGEDGYEDPIQQALANERSVALRQLVDRLPEEEQELLRLRFVADLSFDEMGVLLGRNKDAVKKSVYRLLARMQSQLEERHGS